MVCAVLLVWKVVHDSCHKDFVVNGSCRALAEVVQILNEFCQVVLGRIQLFIVCCGCAYYPHEHSNHFSSSNVLVFN